MIPHFLIRRERKRSIMKVEDKYVCLSISGTAYNRAYLTSVLRTSTKILLRETSDTLETLYAIMEEERLVRLLYY